jgi:hypothetical protein
MNNITNIYIIGTQDKCELVTRFIIVNILNIYRYNIKALKDLIYISIYTKIINKEDK